jgi:SNF2 family DNA or RNA helicase
MEEKGTLALLLDPGLGKTSICLEYFRRQHECLAATRMLVVAPLRTCWGVWPQEVSKWAGFRHLNIHVAHGAKNKKPHLCNGADIVVINPEGLAWLEREIKSGSIHQFDVLVVDESTLFKSGSSKRTKCLFRIGHKHKGGIPHRFILTGTPAPNGVEDLYGQFAVLDPDILGKTLTAFRTAFRFGASKRPWGMVWEPTDRTNDLVQEAIRPHSVRLDANDYLDLPDLVSVHREVTLPKEAMEVYRELKREMLVQINSNSSVVAVNPAALSSKCRQVANGAVYVDDEGMAGEETDRRIEYIHQAKVKELGQLFDELGQKPILVAYEFRHDLQQIRRYMRETYKLEVPFMGSGSSAADTAVAIEKWNSGSLPMLAVNPAAAAHGLNLQAGGHHLCWFGLTWNLEHYQQLNARLWRQGQREAVILHHLIAKDTVDEVVWAAVQKKDATQADLLLGLKRQKT